MALLIINPSATTTRQGTLTVIQRALASEVDLRVIQTNHRGEGAQLARECEDNLIIVYGGDGTVNDVATGLIDFSTGVSRGPDLAVIPGGSTNVFARSLGISNDPVEATAQLLTAIEHGSKRTVSIGGLRMEGQAERTFLFAAGLGVDGHTVEQVERLRRRYSKRPRGISPARYALASLTSISHYIRNENSLTIACDDTVVHAEVAIATTNPVWTYLGTKPLQLTPGADFDSGLGLFTLDQLTPTGTLEVITSLARTGVAHAHGSAERSDIARIQIRAERPVPVQADGEALTPSRTLDLRSLPRALTLLTPVPEAG